jgi:hypothetical protein
MQSHHLKKVTGKWTPKNNDVANNVEDLLGEVMNMSVSRSVPMYSMDYKLPFILLVYNN